MHTSRCLSCSSASDVSLQSAMSSIRRRKSAYKILDDAALNSKTPDLSSRECPRFHCILYVYF